MKRVNYLFVLLLVTMSLFGTAQTPDLIIFKGDTLPLYSLPLNSFPTQALINPKSLFGGSGCFYTGCWRNYIATWKIVDGKLYLVKIRNACYPTPLKGVSASYKGGVDKDSIGSEYADLKALFPERFENGMVKADWVSGELYLPQGELLYYIHDGFQSIYETELKFTLEKGALVEIEKLDNSKTKRSKYSEDSKLLLKYIYDNINHENLPKNDTIKGRVILYIYSSDDNGKIDSVVVVRGLNELYDKEAVRVVKSIPEWDVIYRHGKKINRPWVIPINFNYKDDK